MPKLFKKRTRPWFIMDKSEAHVRNAAKAKGGGLPGVTFNKHLPSFNSKRRKPPPSFKTL